MACMPGGSFMTLTLIRTPLPVCVSIAVPTLSPLPFTKFACAFVVFVCANAEAALSNAPISNMLRNDMAISSAGCSPRLLLLSYTCARPRKAIGGTFTVKLELGLLAAAAVFFFEGLVLLHFLVVRAVVLFQIFVAERPLPGSGGPRLRQNLGVLDGNLIDEIVFARTREALNHVFLIAMEPPDEVVPGPFVDGNYVDRQRIPLPMGGGVSIEGRIRVFGVRPAVGVDHARVVIQFAQLTQFVAGLHQLCGIRVQQEHPRGAAWQTIH